MISDDLRIVGDMLCRHVNTGLDLAPEGVAGLAFVMYELAERAKRGDANDSPDLIAATDAVLTGNAERVMTLLYKYQGEQRLSAMNAPGEPS